MTTKASPASNGRPKTYSPAYRDAVKATMNKREKHGREWRSVVPTSEEVDLFLLQAETYGLDPLAGQIYATWRQGRMRVATTIDGLRLLAERTGKYQGQTAVEWRGKDADWADVWLGQGAPAAARIGVYKEGHRGPTYGTVHYEEFVQRGGDKQPQGMWKPGDGKPAHMLGIRAETLALRKAFPSELGGLYTREEIADGGEHVEQTAPPDASSARAERREPDGAPPHRPPAVAPPEELPPASATRPARAAAIVDPPESQPSGPPASPAQRRSLAAALDAGDFGKLKVDLAKLLFDQQPDRLTDEQTEQLTEVVKSADAAGVTAVELERLCKIGLRKSNVEIRRKALIDWLEEKAERAGNSSAEGAQAADEASGPGADVTESDDAATAGGAPASEVDDAGPATLVQPGDSDRGEAA